MSAFLWKFFFEKDVDNFRLFLANATFNPSAPASKGRHGGHGTFTGTSSSPGTNLGDSPSSHKGKRSASGTLILSARQSGSSNLTRADINVKDLNGCTLLHHIASSLHEDAVQFAVEFLKLPLLDLYVQDTENGWTALHRALYFGNVTVARALMVRDRQDAIGHANSGLIKIKDKEGNSPFDVYGASITYRIIRQSIGAPLLPEGSDDEDNLNVHLASSESSDEGLPNAIIQPKIRVQGDELFTFGSNKNFTLGFGDEDDRHYPERISIKRSDRLLHTLARNRRLVNSTVNPEYEHKPMHSGLSRPIPAVINLKPIVIQDVRLSKFHSAILTNDLEANLYICGFGPGGRLGTGDEVTRFQFVPICGGGLAGKKIADIGLGQNHTIATTNQGEVFSWGSNLFGQLGYNTPSSNINNEEPTQLLPRQIFGPLKRELLLGAAASGIHSVVYTSTSLYTFGKNNGQLGLVDSDARSLMLQNTPRRVGASLFSSPIGNVSAIDRATVCLLENHDVWIFANYGYTKMSFPVDNSRNVFGNHFLVTRYNSVASHISKITSGGDTICAMSNEGDVFTVNLSSKSDMGPANSSTTNPAKIRGAFSNVQKVWTRKKGHMAVKDVDVGQDGSIIICTEAGSVWRRVKRAKVKDVNAPLMTEYKAKDYKFSRIPGLTRITAVRSNIHGAYAAIRGDCDVLRTQIMVECSALWKNLFPLLSFKAFSSKSEDSDTENPRPRFWAPALEPSDAGGIRQAILDTSDIEEAIASALPREDLLRNGSWDINVGTTISKVLIPVHEFVIVARSPILGRALSTFRESYFFSIPEVMTIEYDKDGKILLLFVGVDFLTVINLVLYIYTDVVADVWLQPRNSARTASRYRQVRNELIQIAAHLDMPKLEQPVRTQNSPPKTLNWDLERALREPDFFQSGDVEIELDGQNMRAHGAMLCQRCPFFEGLFNGRAAGRWVSNRQEQSQDTIKVNLKHVNPAAFSLVRRHIYADTGEELFDHFYCSDLESFLNLILEVMFVANELMLDRLSQCCQKTLGVYVNTRNVCQLLNAVAPCSVSEFKSAALEYVCLNLEGMLENNLLDELDDDLLLELDEVIRQNQLARLPISKSGRAEAELLERYPEMVEILKRQKRTRVDQIAFQSRWRHEDAWAKTHVAKSCSADDTPLQKTERQEVPYLRTPQVTSPLLRNQKSAADLMFEMDEVEEETAPTLELLKANRFLDSRPVDDFESPGHRGEERWQTVQSKVQSATEPALIFASTSPLNTDEGQELSPRPSCSQEYISDLKIPKPWESSVVSSEKLNMKDIMAQASMARVSNISSGLSSQTQRVESAVIHRLSQRERKKQQVQAQLRQPQVAPVVQTEPPINDEKHSSPWQVASPGPKVSLKDVIGTESHNHASTPLSTTPRTPSNQPLTMRQTIAGTAPSVKRTASEGTSKPQSPPQNRSTSTPYISRAPATPPRPPSSSRTIPSPASVGPSSTLIHSIRHHHNPMVAEPSLQLSMADILSQQQTEKDVIKEAAAKRSLQEIQEEQAFQEWWDQESRKVREEEAAKAKKVEGRSKGKGRGRGGWRGKGKGVERGGDSFVDGTEDGGDKSSRRRDNAKDPMRGEKSGAREGARGRSGRREA